MLILAFGLTFWNKSLFHLVKNTWEKCNPVIDWLKIFLLRWCEILQGWSKGSVEQVSLLKTRDTFSFGILNTLCLMVVKEEILNSITFKFWWLSFWKTFGPISNWQESKVNLLVWEFFNTCWRCVKAVSVVMFCFWTNIWTFCKKIRVF